MSNLTSLNRMRELTAAAVIGADRSPAAGGPGALLNAAAVLGAQARAGLKPRRVTGALTKCPNDDRPVAGTAAMSTLMRLLSNPDAGMIEEWSELATRKGVRVASETVPLVLDWWSRQPQRSPIVFLALGKAGEWLASLNNAWHKPVAGDEIPQNADELWQTGTAAERAALLLTIRRIDSARALLLVKSTWANDGADERRRFVEVLQENCSMADESFLESALDDKSKVVRRQVAAVLKRIAESRLRMRMNERARGIVVVEGKRGILKRGPRVRLNPPAKFDKEWERDGIEEKAGGGVGQRAWWMRQVLGAAELSLWNEITGLDPDGVFDALNGDDFFDDAVQAMILALEFSGNAAWCKALQQQLLSQDKPDIGSLSSLWATLQQTEREPLMLVAAEHKKFDAETRWSLLAMGDEPWSQEFSVKAVNLLKKNKPSGDIWRLHDSADRISRRISPASIAAFEDALMAMSPDGLPDSLTRSVDRVRLRADMHKEFST